MWKKIGAKNLIVGQIRFCWWFNCGHLIGKTRSFDLRTEFIIWMHFVPRSSSWLTSAVSTIVVFAMSVRGPAASRTKPARGGPTKAPAPLMQVSTPKAEVRRESSSISTLAEGLCQHFGIVGACWTYQHGGCDCRPGRERDAKHDTDDCVRPEVVAEGHQEGTNCSPREGQEGHEECVHFGMIRHSSRNNSASSVEETNQGDEQSRLLLWKPPLLCDLDRDNVKKVFFQQDVNILTPGRYM